MMLIIIRSAFDNSKYDLFCTEQKQFVKTMLEFEQAAELKSVLENIKENENIS